jgi:hypothetical protein
MRTSRRIQAELRPDSAVFDETSSASAKHNTIAHCSLKTHNGTPLLYSSVPLLRK